MDQDVSTRGVGNEEALRQEPFSSLLRRLAEAHEHEMEQALAALRAENTELKASLPTRARALPSMSSTSTADHLSCQSPTAKVSAQAALERRPFAPAAVESVPLPPFVPGCLDVDDDEQDLPEKQQSEEKKRQDEGKVRWSHFTLASGEELLQVQVQSVHGLHAVSPSGGGIKRCHRGGALPSSYCVCRALGCSGSRFKTPVVEACSDPVWDYEGVVCSGGGLVFEVFDGAEDGVREGDATGGKLLGWAMLEENDIIDGGFDGDVQLLSSTDGTMLSSAAVLAVRVRRSSSQAYDGQLAVCERRNSRQSATGLSVSPREAFHLRPVWHPDVSRLVSPSSWKNLAGFCGSAVRDETVLHELSAGCLQRYISFPASPYRLVWDVFGAILIIYDSLVIPLQVFNPPESDFSTAADLFILVFWTVNIFASVFVGYVKNGVTEMRPFEVVKHYVMTWFIADLIVVVPDWVFTMQSIGTTKTGTENSVKLLRIVRLVRTVRLIRLLKLRWIFAVLTDLLSSEYSSILVNIAKMIMTLCIINHYIACMFFLIGDLQRENGQQATWIEVCGFGADPWEYQYLTAFHWSMTQFTPASMEVQPANTLERAFSIAVVVFALVGFSYLVGSITNSQSQLRSITEDASKQFWTLRRYLKHYRVPMALSCRIQRYLEHAWQRQRASVSEPKLFSLLSEQLSNELKCARSLPHLLVHPLFECLHKNSSVSLQRLAVSAISWQNLARGDNLFYPNEVATHLYFVVEGKLHYARFGEHGQRTCEWVDRSEDWIAEPVLWTPTWVHLGTLGAVSEADLVLVDGESFGSIIRLNPAVLQLVSNYARRFMDWANSVPHGQLSDISQGEDISDKLRGFIDGAATERAFSKRRTSMTHGRTVFPP